MTSPACLHQKTSNCLTMLRIFQEVLQQAMGYFETFVPWKHTSHEILERIVLVHDHA